MRVRRPTTCPHCHKPLEPIRFGVPWGPIAIRIIDRLAEASGAGVEADELLVAAYGHNGRAADQRLRSYVSAINRTLAHADSGVAIRSKLRTYWLTDRRRP